MEFRVLGPTQVAADGRVGAPGRGHRRTILALLIAARGRSVSTEQLIDGVWGAAPPASARKSLQSHLSRLRAELGDLLADEPDPLVTTADGYRLDLEAHGVDAHRFEALVDRARAAPEPAHATTRLVEALALWRGAAYGQLASHATIRSEATRLERLRRQAEADLVDARIACGEHEAVRDQLERTTREEPLDERAHAQLMRVLYRTGHQAQALTTYQRLRERLADDLGADPAPPVQQLHQRILRHDPDLDDATSTADSGPAAPRDAAPTRTTGVEVPPELVGREDDLADVSEWLAPGQLVTLTGPGGVGKTRLAERVAAEVAARFRDGTMAVALATVRDTDRVGDAVVTALGIQPTGERSTVDTLVAALGERQLLLLLDNCEHVLSAVAPLVEAILRRCPNVAVLATSRERLHLPHERLWPVRPLDVPATGAGPDELLTTPAGRLFRLRAHATDATFSLDDQSAPAVAELCRRLDGMPLAIELAAARVRAMTPADLVERLDQRFSLLAGGPHHEAGRHRTLHAVVAWSYDLLGPLEAQLFDRLSTFAGSVTLEAVEEVCAGGDIERADVAGLVGELVDKSMVVATRDGARMRYGLLDTLREYGGRRLAASDRPERWRRRHADHHVRLVEVVGPQVLGAREPAAVATLDGAFADIRAAHAWLVRTGDVGGALRIAAGLGDYLFYRLRDEVTTWARRAVDLPGAGDHPAYAAALATAAFGATARVECDWARRQAEQALAQAGSDHLAVVRAHAALGTVALYEGRLGDLLHHADDVATAADRIESDFHRAFAGVLRVLAHSYRGDHAAAAAALDGLDRAADASGSPSMRAFSHYCRGEASLDRRPADAAEALEEAVWLARTVANGLVEGVSMVSLASLRGRLGESRRALAQFRDVIAHWRRLGDETHQLTTLRNLVVLLAALGHDEPAALLHGAVTAGSTPSFGVEAARLRHAWSCIEDRLGPDAAAATARRGRELPSSQVSEVALAQLDGLLAA